MDKDDKDSGGVCSEERLWRWTGVWRRGGYRPPPFDNRDLVVGWVELGNTPLPKESKIHGKEKK